MRPAHALAVLTFAACLLPVRLCGQGAPSTGGAPVVSMRQAPTNARPAACQVEGVWELVSATDGGQERPLRGYRQRKIVSRGHFMWLGADARRDTITLRTSSDSLRAAQVFGGAGTYTLEGNTYTERLELFFDATGEGRTLPATCRTVGDRWYHSFPVADGDAARSGMPPAVEVWRRLR
ncbi:MAG: hypothetical protein ACXW0Z_10620 [Gemmatirosa sp.]